MKEAAAAQPSARRHLVAGVTGLIAGLFGGLVGLGGGVVMIPLLTSWARLTQHEAHATSLAGVVATGIFGALAYARGGAVDLRSAGILALVSVLATYAAARYSVRVPAQRLRRIFGGFLIGAALLLVAKDELLALQAPTGAWTVVVLLAGGLFVGVASGLLGIGGGSLMVPILVIGAGLSQHIAQGTSLAAMVPAGASGTVAHMRNRTVRYDVLPGLLGGIGIGTWAGGSLALAIPSGWLRLMFAIVLIMLGGRYLNAERRARAAARS